MKVEERIIKLLNATEAQLEQIDFILGNGISPYLYPWNKLNLEFRTRNSIEQAAEGRWLDFLVHTANGVAVDLCRLEATSDSTLLKMRNFGKQSLKDLRKAALEAMNILKEGGAK